MIRPLGDRILVKRKEAVSKTASGLYIPDASVEKPQEAEVVDAQSAYKDYNGNEIQVDVKKGDVVLISKYGGTEVEYEGVTYLLVRHSDIWAVID